jgi:Carboxypeptidase regulatory-like domain
VRCDATIEGVFAQRRWASADEKGRFVVRGPSTRHAFFVASTAPKRGTNQAFTSRKVALPAKQPIVLEIDLGVVVSGQVVSSNGKPIEGARLVGRVEDPPAMGPALAGDVEATTGKDGRFSLRQLGGSGVEVEIAAPGHATGLLWFDHPDEDVVVTLEPLGKATGRVVDEAGKAIKRFSIEGEEYTTKAGRFEIELQGAREAMFAAEGRPPVLRTVSAGADLKIVLSRGRSITVRVADSKGRPLAGVEVSDEEVARKWLKRGAFVTAPTFKTDSRGVAKLTGVSGGEVELFIASPHGPQKTVSCGGAQREVRVTLGSGAVEGVAIDELGTLIPNHRVTCDPLTKGLLHNATRTDQEGRFSFKGLAAGDYRVGSNDDGAVRFFAQDVRVTDGDVVRVRLLSRFPYLAALGGSTGKRAPTRRGTQRR